MKLRAFLLNQVERIDADCDTNQEFIDNAKKSLFSYWLYEDELDRLQAQVYKQRLISGMLEIMASLLPKS